MAQVNLEIVLYYFRMKMRHDAQVNPRIVLPKSNWDSPACGQRNPVCLFGLENGIELCNQLFNVVAMHHRGFFERFRR